MICQRCQKEKDEIEFPKRKKEFCKACRNAIAVEKYKGTEKGLSSQERFKRTEKYKQIHRKSNKKRSEAGYYRERYRNNDEFRKKENERRMKHHRDHPEIKKERDKRAILKNPEKNRARGALRQKICRGTIIKPSCCDRCKMEAKRIEAHHHDYSKPFDVLWLCVECHKIEHGKIIGT